MQKQILRDLSRERSPTTYTNDKSRAMEFRQSQKSEVLFKEMQKDYRVFQKIIFKIIKMYEKEPHNEDESLMRRVSDVSNDQLPI